MIKINNDKLKELDENNFTFKKFKGSRDLRDFFSWLGFNNNSIIIENPRMNERFRFYYADNNIIKLCVCSECHYKNLTVDQLLLDLTTANFIDIINKENTININDFLSNI